MAKMKIIGDPIGDMLEEMDRKGIDIKPAVNEALEKTTQLITSNLQSAAAPYQHKGLKGYATGAMYDDIITGDQVKWIGSIAEVNAGFNLQGKGGYHSIFIMYGTPKMDKNTKVYNAVRGTGTKKRIKTLQAEIMMKYMKLGR